MQARGQFRQAHGLQVAVETSGWRCVEIPVAVLVAGLCPCEVCLKECVTMNREGGLFYAMESCRLITLSTPQC